MTSSNTTALSPSTTGDQPAATPTAIEGWQLGDSGPAFWTNLPVDTDVGAALMMAAVGESTDNVEDWFNKPFPTRWLFIEPREVTDKVSGELRPFIYICFIGPEGRTLSFGSNGVLRSLKYISVLKGKGPWDPPLGLIVRQVPLADGKRTYEVRYEGLTVIQGKPGKKDGK